MRITITGKNLEVSDYMREVTEKRLAKLNKYFPEDTEAYVTLSVERSRHIVEVTIPYEGRIVRGEEVSDDMYASFDTVIDKLERQVNRLRSRLTRDHRGESIRGMESFAYEAEDDAGPQIVKVKKFDIKPMNEEEAMMQLELLGHSFFVFRNSDTNQINVLYLRKDGNYGLIEPA